MSLFYSSPFFRPFIFFISFGLLAVCGFINGFVTSRILKFFENNDWKTGALLAAIIFPCYILLTMSLGDIVEIYNGSSAAMPISEGVLYYLIWWALDGPAAVFGSYRGYVTPLNLNPDVSTVKRSIPKQPWYLQPVSIPLLFGPLIFGSIFYEFGYIMESIWRSYAVYGMFFILFASLLMMGVTIASLSVVVTYKSLSHQNYDWWWNSFSLGASGGVYMGLYSAYYLYANEDTSFLSGDFIYYLIMQMISVCFGLMCGAISLLSSYLFVERIYNSSAKGEFTRI